MKTSRNSHSIMISENHRLKITTGKPDFNFAYVYKIGEKMPEFGSQFLKDEMFNNIKIWALKKLNLELPNGKNIIITF